MPLFLPRFFSSFSFSMFFLLLLVSNYYLVVGCFSYLGLFPFSGFLSLGIYYSLTMGFLPYVLFPSGPPSFSVFLSSPVFFLFHSVPFFCCGYLPFIANSFNGISPFYPLRLHQLFLVCCEHPFKITHPPIGCPNHCHCSVHVCYTATYFTTKFPLVCSCCIPLPHYLALWHASNGPNRLLLLLGKIPSQQDIFPKRSHDRKPNIDPIFPPPPNHALRIPLIVGPPPLYWLGTGW